MTEEIPGISQDFSYDSADRVTTMVDALGTVTYSYDLADQLTGKKDRIGRQVTFAYDSGGRRINEWWINSGGGVDRRVTYTYDAADQLTGVNDPDARLTFTYDSGGRMLTHAPPAAAPVSPMSRSPTATIRRAPASA
jgi:YD repeat-containing protein